MATDEPAVPAARDERSELGHGMRGADLASAVVSELLGGLLVWMGIGWLVDRWLATSPWFTIIGALVGYAGGMYLVWLRIQRSEPDGTPRVPGTRPMAPGVAEVPDGTPKVPGGRPKVRGDAEAPR
jgi:F0F1-type ATP synthase assembly protein I